MDKRKIVCGWATNHGTTSCAECFAAKGECGILRALQAAQVQDRRIDAYCETMRKIPSNECPTERGFPGCVGCNLYDALTFEPAEWETE